MNDNTNMKSVIFGWVMLAGAYVIGRKHGWAKCASDVKDVMLKKFIEDEEKKEKGS